MDGIFGRDESGLPHRDRLQQKEWIYCRPGLHPRRDHASRIRLAYKILLCERQGLFISL